MFYPRLLYTFFLASLSATVLCGSNSQRKRLKYGNQKPPGTTTGGSLSLTIRLKKINSQALDISPYYDILTRTEQLQKKIQTACRQSGLLSLPSHREQQGNPSYVNLGGYASSIQPPNPPLLASTSGNSRDASGRNMPVGTNIVQVQEEKVGENTRLVHRTIDFPPFTSMDMFIQIVNKRNLPGDPFIPKMLGMSFEDYRESLVLALKRYSESSRDAKVNSITPFKQICQRLSDIKGQTMAYGRFTLFERDNKFGYKYNSMIIKALECAKVIVVIYCKKADINTYFEVMWHPNHPEYSVERLLAYTMRRYEGVSLFSVKTDGDYGIFLDFLKGIMKRKPADMCSQFASAPSTLSGA